MDCNEAANLLRSEDTLKQLHALKEIIPLFKLKKLIPNDEFLNELIERGLSCEKSTLVRELSFACITIIYQTIKILRWTEVRAAVITEMGTAESAACLYAAIKVLDQLAISELILFIGSKDGMSVMKSCLFSPVVDIGAVSVEALGPLLLDSWLYVQSINPVDGYMNVETTSEARRFRDDISDFVLDMMKNFAEGLKGKAPGLEAGQYLPDHSKTTCAYFSVIGDLFERYCEKYDKLREWTACLLGEALIVPQPEFDTDVTSRSASLSLLIRHVLPIILPDPYSLLIRAKELLFHLAAIKCVSNILLTLLHGLPAECGPNSARHYHLIFEDKPSMQFGTPEEVDETSLSRSKPLNISIIELVEEWTEKVLSSCLLSSVCHEVKDVIYYCLSLTTNPYLSHLRPKICSLIIENSFRILNNSSCGGSLPLPKGRVDLDSHIHPSGNNFYKDVISWTLFSCRYVPRSILGEYLPFFLAFICRYIADDISRTKLISECAILLLINVDSNGSVAHPEVLFQTLGHPVISALFLSDSGTSVDPSSPHSFRERFVTALCRTIVKMIPIAVAYAISTDGALGSAKPDDSFGGSVINLTPAKTSNISKVGEGKLPFSGFGCYAELFGTTLRSSGQVSDESNSYSLSTDLALQQIDHLVASALFVLRSSHKCILWPIVGLAGECAQLAYIDLISSLIKLVVVTPSLTSQPPLVQNSLSWSKDPLVDTLSALLTLISGSEKIPSENARYQLLILFSQHLQILFVDYEDRYKLVLNLLRNILLRTEQRELYQNLLASRSELGYVGGWISSRPSHSFLSIPSQHHALTILELFVYYNSKIKNLPECVLGVLYECEELLEAESKRQHHIISPLIDQRLLLAIRRVKFYCIEEKQEAGEKISNTVLSHQSPNAKGGFTSVDGTPKKMITSRRVSAAFTTFDNSMSDAFITPEINRKRVDVTATPAHMSSGLDVVDTMFRIQIAPEYSLPIDVEKIFSMFSAYALSLNNNLNSTSSKASDAYVCTSDLVGLIDDVLDSHLLVNPPHFQKIPPVISSENNQRAKLVSETYDLRDTKVWKQINGSSDMFTVLCSVLSYDSGSQNVRLAVRVINSSGFKVPLFSVQLLLSSLDLYNTSSSSALKASFDSNKTSTILDGVEYFNLDGLVERMFTIHFHQFTNSFLNVRLIYRELLAESDSVEIFSIPSASVVPQQVDEGNTIEQKKRFKEADLCRTAKLECIPFKFSVYNFLHPYGGGSLSSMTNYRLDITPSPSIAVCLGGIPKSIYQSLHNRLKRSVRLPVIAYCTTSKNTIPNFSDEITLEYYHQYNLAKEDFSRRSKIHCLMNSRVRLGNGNHSSLRQISTSLAWCFQTWWGHEVCVTIQISKLSQSPTTNPFVSQRGNATDNSDNGDCFIYWSGWMEIQCDDISTLSALQYDSLGLIQFLTTNLMQITSPSSLTASTILPSSSKGIDIITTHSLSQSNGLFPLIDPSNISSGNNLMNIHELQHKETANREKKMSIKSKIRNFMHQKFLSENKTPHDASTGGGVSLL